jgi:hypothetical protein
VVSAPWKSWDLSPVNVSPVPDLHHNDNESIVFDFVDDSIVALPNPVIFQSGKFDAAGRAGIISE